MATVINNPDQGDSSGSSGGWIVAIIVLLVVVVLFFIYGLPSIRNGNKGTTVNVPDKVQVDVNGSGASQ